MPLSKIDSDSLNSPITAVNLAYTGTLTGNGGIVNIGSGQVYKDASGNVGIGTSSPAARLHATKNTADVARFTNSLSNGGDWEFKIGGGGFEDRKLMITDKFSGADNVRVAIDSSGNLLVGQTSGGSRLDVLSPNAGVYAGYFTFISGGYGVGIRNSSGGSAALMYFFSPNYVGEISTNGTTTSYVTASDYRLKNTITPMTGALAKVAALNPVSYKWNADDSDGEGFIAHELQAVCPSAVSGEKDAVGEDGKPKYQGVDVSFLVATLTAAIQELKAIVDAQGAEIAALKGTP